MRLRILAEKSIDLLYNISHARLFAEINFIFIFDYVRMHLIVRAAKLDQFRLSLRVVDLHRLVQSSDPHRVLAKCRQFKLLIQVELLKS